MSGKRRFWLQRQAGAGRFSLLSPWQWRRVDVEPWYDATNELGLITSFRVTERTPFGLKRSYDRVFVRPKALTAFS